LEKRTKNISIPIQICNLSFVDDGLLISQEKNFKKSKSNIFCSYNIIYFLFRQFGLVIKQDKSEVFHFSRAIKNLNPLTLDLKLLGGIVLRQKDIW